jgi:hypothetical protein
VKYPSLAPYTIATHARPKGIRVEHNVCVGGTWRQLMDGLTEAETGFKDNLVDDGRSEIREARWPAIPLDRIGLIKDRWRPSLPARR